MCLLLVNTTQFSNFQWKMKIPFHVSLIMMARESVIHLTYASKCNILIHPGIVTCDKLENIVATCLPRLHFAKQISWMRRIHRARFVFRWTFSYSNACTLVAAFTSIIFSISRYCSLSLAGDTDANSSRTGTFLSTSNAIVDYQVSLFALSLLVAAVVDMNSFAHFQWQNTCSST